MTKIAYVDCFSGLSGDMFLGALVDAGLDPDELRRALERLPVAGYELTAEKVTRQGVSGTAVRVRLRDPSGEPHRHLADVIGIVEDGNLDPGVREGAVHVFRRLAEAEARVHGIPIAEVHFHEVGAVDAIVDVVGVVWGLHRLGIEKLYASSVPTGSGTVRTAHGPLPVPAPATLALLAAANAPLRPGPVESRGDRSSVRPGAMAGAPPEAASAEGELVTPTGAALIATLAEFRQPAMLLERLGYGFGQKTFPWPNVARLWIGQATEAAENRPSPGDELEYDIISIIETNLDDERPNVVAAAMEALFAAGALDVFFTPIQMKKNRPAIKLTVLAPVEATRALSEIILRETATLGIRVSTADRLKARRWTTTVQTRWGEVRVKVKEFGGRRRGAPEYDDCQVVARGAGVPVAQVYEAAMVAAAEQLTSPPGRDEG